MSCEQCRGRLHGAACDCNGVVDRNFACTDILDCPAAETERVGGFLIGQTEVRLPFNEVPVRERRLLLADPPQRGGRKVPVIRPAHRGAPIYYFCPCEDIGIAQRRKEFFARNQARESCNAPAPSAEFDLETGRWRNPDSLDIGQLFIHGLCNFCPRCKNFPGMGRHAAAAFGS